jgi:hypothetical protein
LELTKIRMSSSRYIMASTLTDTCLLFTLIPNTDQRRKAEETMSEAAEKTEEKKPEGGRGPRRGPRGGGDKTCYNCGQVSYH